MMVKLISTFLVVALLSGCSSFGGFSSGTYNKRPAVNPVTGELLTDPLTRRPIYEVNRVARPVAIMQASTPQVVQSEQQAPAVPLVHCNYLAADQIAGMSATGQAEYFRGVSSCQQSQFMSQALTAMPEVVNSALNRPVSEADALARAGVKAVQAAENGLTNRVRAVANPLAVTIGVKSVAKSFERVGTAAAETGNITVGSVNSSASRHAAGGAHGEEGMFAVPEGGPSSSQVIIGNNNRTATAFDSGQAVNGINQDLATSATGNVNNDGKQNGTITADEQNGQPVNNDDDGGNSLL